MIRSFLLALMVAGLTGISFAGMEDVSLRGVWVHGGTTELYLAKDGSVRWVAVGGYWGDTVVEKFDHAIETALVRDGRGLHQLVLAEAKAGRGEGSVALGQRKTIADNLTMLTTCACQHLLEQRERRVSATELVGGDRDLYCIESAAGETYDDATFSVGRNGIELRIAGARMPISELPQPVVIQAQPTQSLAAISEHLHIPLPVLRNLNPHLTDVKRFTAIERVRLH